ncbi:MAG: amidohydrolase [Candidatus Bathyarchaeia archaeon]
MDTLADLVLIDGKIVTMNPLQPNAEAVAVKGDRIVRVGTTEEVSYMIGKDTKIVYLDWRCVVPGLIDTHIHVGDYARFLMWLDLAQVKSIKDMQALLKHRVAGLPAGKWVVGRGWNEERFAERRLPTRFDLDAVAPENPVIFYYECGPVLVANTKALHLAGVDKDTTNPSGGSIDRDAETGEPTGILRDAATDLVWSKMPEPTEDELVEASAEACTRIVAAGVTGVHWLATSKADAQILKRLCRAGRLPLRVFMVVPASFMDDLDPLEGLNKEIARVGGVEVQADGYLAMGTAALHQPYDSDHKTNGELLASPAEIAESARKISASGLQVVIHAMGDQAVDAALSALEEAKLQGKHRLDQAALLHPELIARIKAQEAVVSVQPLVAASEFSVYSAEAHLGKKRARWLYPLKTLVDAGVRVCAGSDCPMEPLSPLLGIESLLAREHFPEERVSVYEALRMYTANAAYATGEENLRGSVEEGKLADLTVLSSDLRQTEPTKIHGVKVEMTIVGGKAVFMR